MIPLVFIAGVSLDKIGRRVLISIGLVLCGGMLILMTYVHNVYPTLLILWLLMCIGAAPFEVSPLMNDYIEPHSFGTT